MKIISATFCVLVVLSFAIGVSAQKTKIESVYTSLKAENCRTVEQSDEGSGWYRGECKGVGGYLLQVTEGDIRQSIDVIAPGKKKYELDFTGHISTGFSSVGAKAEWRVLRQGKIITPIAFIVRFNVSENSGNSSIITSYLVVNKITKNQICTTEVIKPSVQANEEARKLADAAADKPCKSSDN